MTRAVWLVVCVVALAGCGRTKKDHTEDLLRSSMRYQEGLRWSRFEDAAALRPAPDREAFLDEHDELAEDLKIDEYEVLRVHMQAEQKQARVQVKYRWHLDSRGIVHETVAEQHWERDDRGWLLVDEWHKRGDEMPGLPDEPRPTTPVGPQDDGDLERARPARTPPAHEPAAADEGPELAPAEAPVAAPDDGTGG